MSVSTNPYAPPISHVADILPASSEAEAIRLEHIKHETSVRSIGLLYYMSGAFLVLSGLAIVVPALSEGRWPAFVLIAICLGIGVLSIVVGRGIRTLQPWARTICIVLAVIGLLAFPVGTMINGYILYLLHAEKGKRIFKDDYAAIMAATPGVKYRTSPVVWIVLGIIVLLVAAAIVVPILSS